VCLIQPDIPEHLVEYASGLLLVARDPTRYQFVEEKLSLDISSLTTFPRPFADYERQGILIQGVTISPNGAWILIDAYSTNEDIRFPIVIEMSTGQEINLGVDLLRDIDMKFMEWIDSNTFAIHYNSASSMDIYVDTVNVRTGNHESIHIDLQNQPAQYGGVALSADGGVAAIVAIGANESGTRLVDQIGLYDVYSGDKISTFETERMDSLYFQDWSPIGDNLVIATIDTNSSIRILNWNDQELITMHSLEVDVGQPILWSPDGRFLLYGDGPFGTTAPVRIFDTYHETSVSPCIVGDPVWSPNSRYVALFVEAGENQINEEHTIYLFDVLTGDTFMLDNVLIDLNRVVRIVGWADLPAS